jgi:catechol 2,3-dioxygenase-like lactoylglutathione lyase family enzyme
MDLGTFSVSLTVKDIKASREFYEKFGFTAIGGSESDHWLILKNGEAKIGLFQGMFDKNTLTFNPTDMRSIQRELKQQGLTFALEADLTTQGPAHAMLFDPDGNPILLDQHA